MIHGSYELELYCDGPQCGELGPSPSVIVGYFSGGTEGAAHKKAREAGWKVLVSKDKALCKDCQ